MNKTVETIRKYFRMGLYTKTHLEMLESKGILTEEERKAMEKGE